MRDESLASRLIVKRFANGRCSYDEDAKQELVERCLESGASVARIARDHGVNANLVHTWISLYRKQRRHALVSSPPAADTEVAAPAFIPVVTTPTVDAVPLPRELELDVTLSNGVHARLRCLSRDDVQSLLSALATMPCSASTRR